MAGRGGPRPLRPRRLRLRACRKGGRLPSLRCVSRGHQGALVTCSVHVHDSLWANVAHRPPFVVRRWLAWSRAWRHTPAVRRHICPVRLLSPPRPCRSRFALPHPDFFLPQVRFGSGPTGHVRTGSGFKRCQSCRRASSRCRPTQARFEACVPCQRALSRPVSAPPLLLLSPHHTPHPPPRYH